VYIPWSERQQLISGTGVDKTDVFLYEAAYTGAAGKVSGTPMGHIARSKSVRIGFRSRTNGDVRWQRHLSGPTYRTWTPISTKCSIKHAPGVGPWCMVPDDQWRRGVRLCQPPRDGEGESLFGRRSVFHGSGRIGGSESSAYRAELVEKIAVTMRQSKFAEAPPPSITVPGTMIQSNHPHTARSGFNFM